MPNRQGEQKKVYGLALQSNSFTVPEGSYEKLDNAVITQDNIVKKRRGESLFTTISGTTGRNLADYQGKLLGLCSDEVQVYNQNSDGTYLSTSVLSGASFTIPAGMKGRNVQANGNFYFTADEGVIKLESVTANVLEAGIPPATDLQIFNLSQESAETFFRPDSQIGYRVLFGRKDANNNTVIGAPSQFVSSTNPTRDDAATLAATTVTVSAVAHGLSPGDVIYVTGADSTGVPDGNYTVATTPTADQFTFSANTGTAGTTLSWGSYKFPTLEWAIPSGVSDEFFWRLYRTSVSAGEDIPPDESTLQLIDEQNITSSQITTGFIVYEDETPDILRGSYLYTNPNTGEPRGILEANEPPPKSSDVAVFKNAVWYANVETQYSLALNLISSNATSMPDGAEFKITQGMTVRNYIGALDPKVGNRTVVAESVSFLLTTVTITQTGHGLNNGDVIAIAQALDSSGNQLASLPQGLYTVSNSAANTFDITAPSTPTGLDSVSFSGISTAGGKRIYYIEDSANTTVASALGTTARAIVRAINRDSSSPVYAYYTSAPNAIPGAMLFRSKEVTSTFTVNAVSSAIVDSFNPPIPTSGNDVIGTRDDGQGVIYFSKPNEPEAVPIVNNLTIGNKGSAILRIAPLRDSLIVLKEDGVFRVNGDSYANFVVTVLDSTVLLKASDSVTTLDNQVFCLAEQGVVAISETTATIVSRAIEPLFTSIAGKSALEEQTHALAYESERLYVLTTISPTEGVDVADRVYVYNHLTRAWSTWNTMLFLDAIVKKSDDKLYFIDDANTIFQERKLQNRLDYCGQDFQGTVTSIVSSNSAIINFPAATGRVGDIVIFNDIISRITDVVTVGITTTYTFASNITFEATDSVTLYRGITTTIRTSPFFGGTISLLKQFSELQASFRNTSACTDMQVYFISDSTSSPTTNWSSIEEEGGFGELPWGAFPWGLEEGINIIFDTAPSQPMRLYVPLETQRSTYIQADMTHNSAAQSILMQSLAFTVRQYKQRTTK